MTTKEVMKERALNRKKIKQVAKSEASSLQLEGAVYSKSSANVKVAQV